MGILILIIIALVALYVVAYKVGEHQANGKIDAWERRNRERR